MCYFGHDLTGLEEECELSGWNAILELAYVVKVAIGPDPNPLSIFIVFGIPQIEINSSLPSRVATSSGLSGLSPKGVPHAQDKIEDDNSGNKFVHHESEIKQLTDGLVVCTEALPRIVNSAWIRAFP